MTIQRSRIARRRLPPVILLVIAALLGSASSIAGVERGRSSDLARALVRKRDMPAGWSRYEPRQDGGGFRVCGEPPTSRHPRDQESIAFAEDPDYGPIFGERIEILDRKKAQSSMKQRQDLALPCEWDQYDTHWQAVAEPTLDVEAENVVYRIDNLSGPSTFNYEVAVRRGGTLLLFVLNTRTQDRELLTHLVDRAIQRYNSSAPD